MERSIYALTYSPEELSRNEIESVIRLVGESEHTFELYQVHEMEILSTDSGVANGVAKESSASKSTWHLGIIR